MPYTIDLPSVLVVILIGLLLYIIKTTNTRQNKNDIRYDELVRKSIDTAKALADAHEKSLRDIITELRDIKSEIKVVGIRIDEYTKIIESERHKLFLFDNREEREDKRR